MFANRCVLPPHIPESLIKAPEHKQSLRAEILNLEKKGLAFTSPFYIHRFSFAKNGRKFVFFFNFPPSSVVNIS